MVDVFAFAFAAGFLGAAFLAAGALVFVAGFALVAVFLVAGAFFVAAALVVLALAAVFGAAFFSAVGDATLSLGLASFTGPEGPRGSDVSYVRSMV